MVRVDSNWILSRLLRLPGPSHLLAVCFVHEGPVLRLALLAAVLQHLAPPTLLQAFGLLLPVKDKAVAAHVQQSSGAILSEFFKGVWWKVRSHLGAI